MAVDPETLASFRAQLDGLPDTAENDLSSLSSIAAVIGYVIACNRAEGRDDDVGVELLLAAVDLDRQTLRSTATTLKRLGYVEVAEMMRRLARRAKPKALPSQPGRHRPQHQASFK